MHFSIRFPWTEAEEDTFVEEEDMVEDVLTQQINQNRQRTRRSSQDDLHKIIAKYRQTNQGFNVAIKRSMVIIYQNVVSCSINIKLMLQSKFMSSF